MSTILFVHCFSVSKAEVGVKRWMLIGWVVGNFVFVFYWMPNPIAPFRDFSLQSAWILGIFFYFCNISSLLLNAFLYKKVKLKKPNLSFTLCILMAALFTFIDNQIPQFIPVSFPHTLLRVAGTSFWAALGGIPLITFLIYLLFLIIAECRKTKSVLIISFISIAFYTSPSLFQVKPETIKTLKINLVEPNVPNDIKRKVETVSLRDLINSVAVDVIHTSGKEWADLVIWPETALPVDFKSEHLEGENKFFAFKKEAIHGDGLLTGLFIESPKDRKVTNSAVLFSEDKMLGRYDKGYLKPFAETFPIAAMIPLVERIMEGKYTVSAGQPLPFFKFKNTSFSASICYEALKSSYLRDSLNISEVRPDFMVNIANDNWFLDSSQPYLHFFMYQWRSLEFNLPVVRVGNGGASGVAYPHDLDHFRSDYPRKMNHIIKLQIYSSDKTYYQRYGFYVVFFFALLLTLFGFLVSLIYRKLNF